MEQTTPAPLVPAPLPSRVTALQPRPAPKTASLTYYQIIGFLLVHIPLLLVFQAAPFVASIHSLGVFLLGCHLLIRDEHPARVTWVIAYIAGCEILWRAVEGTIFYEFGKYTTILLCLGLLVKFPRIRENNKWPIAFVGLLIPGLFIASDFDRQAIAFQLAGPVALAIVSMVFVKFHFLKGDLQRVFLALIAPALAMTLLIAFVTGTQDVEFSAGGSNEEVTDSIGANQVTAALSLGGTAAFFSIFLYRDNFRARNLMILIFLVTTVAAVLTFSRSGFWNTVIALLAGAVFLFRDPRRSFQIVGLVLFLMVVGAFVIFPALEDLTEGQVTARFSDFDSTGRDILIRIDWELFLANPIFGVGVGVSPLYHYPAFGYLKPTHTEYGRMLAEHGLFGAIAILILAAVLLGRVFGPRSGISKSITAGFTAWALFYMLHSATRLVAPSFAFGLAAARFLPEEDSPNG